MPSDLSGGQDMAYINVNKSENKKLKGNKQHAPLCKKFTEPVLDLHTKVLMIGRRIGGIAWRGRLRLYRLSNYHGTSSPSPCILTDLTRGLRNIEASSLV